MKLQCLDGHMANQSVLINGTRYKLDKNCLVTVTNEDDQKRMLASKSWKVYVERSPQPTKASKPAPKVTKPEAPKATKAPTYEAPKDGDDWPDPTEEMPIEFLREMATAYEVKFAHNTKPATLVKKIMAAMYD